MAGDRPSARNPNLCTNSRVNQGRQLTESQHEQQLVQIEWGISLSPREVVEERNISGMVEASFSQMSLSFEGMGPAVSNGFQNLFPNVALGIYVFANWTEACIFCPGMIRRGLKRCNLWSNEMQRYIDTCLTCEHFSWGH